MQIITFIFLHIFTFILLFALTISSSPVSSPSPSPSPLYSLSSQSLSPTQPPIQQSGSDYSFQDPWSPSPALPNTPSSLAPGPTEASDVGDMKSEERKESPDKGMSGGKKVGVAFGLIAAACFVGFGGVLYRKRQDNIRRARYSQSARLEFF
uniref:proline-rich receptor-like protein kinase PERK1 n=1 Tax=Erigeron canadensis TaxID=72917 RepID=UPI001CB8F56E|nr:proline-rich receptor-like protein kinase PERK1 [Erigeron canadensis]